MDTNRVEPDEYDKDCIRDCLQLSTETRHSAGEAMLAMHQYFAEECGDLDVSLDSVEEIWRHTAPWYVFIRREDRPGRYLRFHFKADWETWHGVEVVIRDGTEILFVGNCGHVNRISKIKPTQKGNFIR